jgi:hypothetical protein
MIDERPSLDAAGNVSLSNLVTYLRSTGWQTQSSPMKMSTIFSIDPPGADETIYLVLPNGNGSDDERRRIADALRTLAVLEEREIPEIAQEIKSQGAVRSAAVRSVRTSARLYAQGSYSVSYPISTIGGMTVVAASRLKSVGIRTTKGLLESARTAKNRKGLAAKTGITEQQLLEWANIADYMRIPGMGKAKVGLLRAAGVATVRELALRNPTRLVQNMKDVNSKRKLVRVLPSEKSVEQLIEQARKLPRKIIY